MLLACSATDMQKSFASYHGLYKQGVAAYLEEMWPQCAVEMESALHEYKEIREAIGLCIRKCYKSGSDRNEFKSCLHECIDLKYEASDVVKDGINSFEEFQDYKPYDYLQICAYKVKKI